MNTINQLHWLDVVAVVALVIAALIGARRGVLRQTGRLTAYVVAFYIALGLHVPADGFMRTHLHQVADDVSKLHIFLAVYVMVWIVYLIGAYWLRRLARTLSNRRNDHRETLDMLGLNPIDRLLGAGVGVVAMCLLLGGGLISVGSVSDEEVRTALAGSKLKPHLIQAMHTILNAVPERERKEFMHALERLEKVGRELAAQMGATDLRHGADNLRFVAQNQDMKVEIEQRFPQDAISECPLPQSNLEFANPFPPEANVEITDEDFTIKN